MAAKKEYKKKHKMMKAAKSHYNKIISRGGKAKIMEKSGKRGQEVVIKYAFD